MTEKVRKPINVKQINVQANVENNQLEGTTLCNTVQRHQTLGFHSDEMPNVEVLIDRITIMAELPEESLSVISSMYSGVLIKEHCIQTNYVKFSIDNIYCTYTRNCPLNQRNFRIDFNPRETVEEALIHLNTSVLPYLINKGLSRLDVAFDVNADLNDGYYIYQSGIHKSKYYYGKDSLETLYLGSPSSARYLRIYDKKNQLREIKEIEIDEPFLWRIEYELRNNYVDNLDESITELLNGLIIRQLSIEQLSDKEYFTAKVLYDYEMAKLKETNDEEENPLINPWNRLSTNSKTKYRKILRELPPERDLVPVLQNVLLQSKQRLLDEIGVYLN